MCPLRISHLILTESVRKNNTETVVSKDGLSQLTATAFLDFFFFFLSVERSLRSLFSEREINASKD